MPSRGNGAPKSPTDAKLDSAIAAAEAAPIAMEQVTVTISTTKRPFVVAFPPDLTDQELLEVIGWMGQGLRLKLLANRQTAAGGRIVLPGRPT